MKTVTLVPWKIIVEEMDYSLLLGQLEERYEI